jgi:hypothetical protein
MNSGTAKVAGLAAYLIGLTFKNDGKTALDIVEKMYNIAYYRPNSDKRSIWNEAPA